jgi:hypothetical protein
MTDMSSPPPPTTLEGIVGRLNKHEQHSQQRFEALQKAIHDLATSHTGAKQMDGHGVHDKVEIHNTGSEGGSGMGSLGGLAALAALGRGHDGMHGGLGGFTGGILGGGLGGLVAGVLPRLFGRGEWGGEGGREPELERYIALSKLGDIQCAIATSANEMQAVVNQNGNNNVQTTLQQTIALQQALAGLASTARIRSFKTACARLRIKCKAAILRLALKFSTVVLPPRNRLVQSSKPSTPMAKQPVP